MHRFKESFWLDRWGLNIGWRITKASGYQQYLLKHSLLVECFSEVWVDSNSLDRITPSFPPGVHQTESGLVFANDIQSEPVEGQSVSEEISRKHEHFFSVIPKWRQGIILRRMLSWQDFERTLAKTNLLDYIHANRWITSRLRWKHSFTIRTKHCIFCVTILEVYFL